MNKCCLDKLFELKAVAVFGDIDRKRSVLKT